MDFIAALFGKRPDLAAAAAQSLVRDFILARDAPIPHGLELSGDQKARLQERIRTDRAGAALLIVRNEARRNRKLDGLRAELERRLLHELQKRGASPHERLKEATARFKGLLSAIAQQKQLTWAGSWLAEAGIETHDIGALLGVSGYWHSYVVALTEGLREFADVAP